MPENTELSALGGGGSTMFLKIPVKEALASDNMAGKLASYTPGTACH